ncbi:GTPase-associated system all-helical protein GASH [Kribbella sp. WER1]
MSEDALLRFLSSGLIDVGGDDTKLEKLRLTAGDLAGALKKEPTKAIAYALVAFDPLVPADDPVVVEALAALQKRWETYANTFAGPPVAVVRAMLVSALLRTAAENDDIAVAFVNLARNVLPLIEADGEQPIWADVVIEVERRVDKRAEAEWTTPTSIAVPAMNFDLPESEAPTVSVDRARLTKKLQAAAGPQADTVATNGNPHWAHQAPQAWVAEFGTRMADAVGQTIENAISESEQEQTQLSEALQALVTAVSNLLEEAVGNVTAATAGLERRTRLLWWKETLFSQASLVSYRDLPPSAAATLMAYDLHLAVPTFSPASVSAFLRETVLTLPAIDAEKTYSICELVAEAQAQTELSGFRSTGADLFAAPDGRRPVMALVARPEVPGSRDERLFHQLTGVTPESELTLPAWATWVFRELQAARAVTEAAKAKRRVRRA